MRKSLVALVTAVALTIPMSGHASHVQLLATCGGLAPVVSLCEQYFLAPSADLGLNITFGGFVPYEGYVEARIHRSDGRNTRYDCAYLWHGTGTKGLCRIDHREFTYTPGEQLRLTGLAVGAGEWKVSAYGAP